MAKFCETSDDDAEIADVGNDLLELRLLLNAIKEKAISRFGNSVMKFGCESL